MKALLICPAERAAFNLLTEHTPLANLPLLGQSMLEYWLAYLAAAGVKEACILASDRPGCASDLVGNGARWGIAAEVVSETRELSPNQALSKYESRLSPDSSQNGLVVLDHFPGRSQPLFSAYSDWLSEVLAWIPSACGPDRVGVRELQPGIWVNLSAHISKRAQLRSPCWIGKRAYIGDGAIVGPGAVVEDRCFIETGVDVSNSLVGPDTFVGRYSEIRNSIAWGDTLINGKTGSAARIPDPFLLCSLRRPLSADTRGWFGRMTEVLSRNKTDVQLIWNFLMNREG